MKNIGKLLAVSAILGFLALMAIPVGAIAAGDALCPKFLAGMGPGDGERLTAPLDQLESLGYDVSEIRAAVESGDYETAHTLMQQFMEEHKDELPAPPSGMGPGDGERLTAPLDQLESLGYDVSDIRAAVESGDYETAHMLMRQFMEEHKDDLPAPPAGERTGEGKTPPPRASISGERPGTRVLKDRTVLNG